MSKYYVNKEDFTGNNFERMFTTIHMSDILEQIAEIVKTTHDQGLDNLYEQTGSAGLNTINDMPAGTFKTSFDRVDKLIYASTRIHSELLQRIDGKFTTGMDQGLQSLNRVNGKDNIYKTHTLKYNTAYEDRQYKNDPYNPFNKKEIVSYDENGEKIVRYRDSGIMSSYTLTEILYGRDFEDPKKWVDFPFKSAEKAYRMKLEQIRMKMVGLRPEELAELKGKSDEELVEYFSPRDYGSYDNLKVAPFFEDHKSWLESTEEWIGPVLTVAGTAMMFIPVVQGGSAYVLGAGAAISAANSGSKVILGYSPISGTKVDTEEKIWTVAEETAALFSKNIGRLLSYRGIHDARVHKVLSSAPDAVFAGKTIKDLWEGEDITQSMGFYLLSKGSSGLQYRASNPKISKIARAELSRFGDFKDQQLEATYRQYLEDHRSRGGKNPQERLVWLGQRRYHELKAQSERNRSLRNYVHLSNDMVVPSYNVRQKEIIFRETYLDGFKDPSGDFLDYLKKTKEKYPVGQVTINSDKYPKLDGKTLEGSYVLEVGKENIHLDNIDEFKEVAKAEGITIRFI